MMMLAVYSRVFWGKGQVPRRSGTKQSLPSRLIRELLSQALLRLRAPLYPFKLSGPMQLSRQPALAGCPLHVDGHQATARCKSESHGMSAWSESFRAASPSQKHACDWVCKTSLETALQTSECPEALAMPFSSSTGPL